MQRKVFKSYLLTIGLYGASSKPAFSRTCCIGSTSIFQFKYDRQTSSGANDQANVLQFAAFRDHGWGHVARMLL